MWKENYCRVDAHMQSCSVRASSRECSKMTTVGARLGKKKLKKAYIVLSRCLEAIGMLLRRCGVGRRGLSTSVYIGSVYYNKLYLTVPTCGSIFMQVCQLVDGSEGRRELASLPGSLPCRQAPYFEVSSPGSLELPLVRCARRLDFFATIVYVEGCYWTLTASRLIKEQETCAEEVSLKGMSICEGCTLSELLQPHTALSHVDRTAFV